MLYLNLAILECRNFTAF